MFSKRWFSDDVISLCVRWYLRFQVSYREMAEIAWELGILVAPSTILRWVIRYAAEFERCWRVFEQPVGRSWRCNET
jgi:transposase-like protein